MMSKRNNQIVSADRCKQFADAYCWLEGQLVAAERQLAASVDNAELEQQLDQLEEKLEDWEILVQGISFRQIEKIKETLVLDYQKCLDNLRFFGLIDQNRLEYGTDNNQLPVDLRRFAIPDSRHIISAITIAQFKEIKAMQEKGWEPRLQLTPIAHSFKQIGGKLADRLAEINFRHGGVSVSSVNYSPIIFEERLSYDPVEARANKNMAKPTKSWVANNDVKNKKEWVEANRGVLVDIVPMRPEPLERQSYNLEKLAEKLKQGLESGQRLMSYEVYLVAQMMALKEGKYLDGECYNILQGSFIHDINFSYFGDYVSYGGLDANRIHLDAIGAGFSAEEGEFVVRPTLRIDWQ